MLISTLAKNFTKITVYTCFGLMACTLFGERAFADWNIDFSRRARSVRESDLRAAGQPSRSPASEGAGTPMSYDAPSLPETPAEGGSEAGLFDTLFGASEPMQEIVILNTDKGFVPSQVRVRKNGRYKVHVVNVNEKEKNVSFILEGFSEHHATYYGKIKTFYLEPRKEGVFSFQSPETSSEGRLTVFNPEIAIRTPASEGRR